MPQLYLEYYELVSIWHGSICLLHSPPDKGKAVDTAIYGFPYLFPTLAKYSAIYVYQEHQVITSYIRVGALFLVSVRQKTS